ncbi:hypothetical protein LSH36_536g01036 [Paralvinella palmiformis]|uniref:Uncharacterized protein n=1 Tax=Paralvinella palmiformis TaxID=53620 RepID=A0AAD9J864_9ANNE|nr:hypothetical protein LSH36_536g01036 [Paralvinella palmiformis]
MDEVSVVSISDIINDNKLQRYQCFLPQGTPNGITNYVIMCKRNSPFMRYLTSQLALSKDSGVESDSGQCFWDSLPILVAPRPGVNRAESQFGVSIIRRVTSRNVIKRGLTFAPPDCFTAKHRTGNLHLATR